MPEDTLKSSRILTSLPVDWRAVRAFLALAFGLAWTIEGVALSRGVRFTSLTVKSTVLLASVMFTPAIAAFIVRRFITHEGFATSGLRRGPWRPYLWVWIGVPVLVAGICGLTILIGMGRFDPTVSTLTLRMQEAARGRPLPHLPSPLVLSAVVLPNRSRSVFLSPASLLSARNSAGPGIS